IGSRVDTNVLAIKANWKICVENTLESYHVGFVHKESFHRLGLKDEGFEFFGPHSIWRAGVDDQIASKFKRVEALYESRPLKVPGYHHLLIFPTTTIATTYGSSFAIQQFVPVSAGETKFVSHVFRTKLQDVDSKS